MLKVLLNRTAPKTRYQGSKQKLLPWISAALAEVSFDTMLDAFGGTGCVSYEFKKLGKLVTYNDYLRFNQLIGLALIENQHVRLMDEDVDLLLKRSPGRKYGDFIERTFPDVYFTPEENAWLDVICQNIGQLDGDEKRAIAFFALFQACIIKRPYNLFHRKNLYMRTAEVERSFGNKATWDTPFEEHFRRFVDEANSAVFDSGRPCRSLCSEASEIPGNYDLVYIDPPYINGRGTGVDYLEFYHFLEGLTDYAGWPDRVEYRRKHKPFKKRPNPWSSPKSNLAAFAEIFDRFRDSILVVSYRSDGTPTTDELVAAMKAVKGTVEVVQSSEYKYVLSTKSGSREVLLIAK